MVFMSMRWAMVLETTIANDAWGVGKIQFKNSAFKDVKTDEDGNEAKTRAMHRDGAGTRAEGDALETTRGSSNRDGWGSKQLFWC